ncbi:hypothetical protein CAEBREN_23198 [Caenorhabditis brenneri]|uniref:Elongin-C n=1 Tax=Caenorhabditis brenneri TaxID=135651 RepID=G0MYJ6_CAEBE|nr:hypothetical protein CAEBREN_23198 [Caenorhabditis brenneri]
MTEPSEREFKKLNLVEEDKEKEAEEEAENEDEEEKSGEGTSSPPPIHYPGLLGENSEYVKLVSNDNHEFVIRRELAEISKVLKEMLRTPGGNGSNTVYLHMINSRTLSKMCNYLSYHKQYLKKEGEIEPFEIDPRDGYELLLVAGFFEI